MHIAWDQLAEIDVCEGEKIWKASGIDIGVNWTSVLVTQTEPGCGPPMHVHQNDELHILDRCEVDYDIGGERFHVSGPGLVHIPANVSHCFVNTAPETFRLVAVFSTEEYTFEPVGPNSIQSDQIDS